jgi:hypothetical protein
MSAHTPGPWETGRGTIHGFTVYGPDVSEHAGPDELAVICEGATEANARLIAAAPELPEAARRAEPAIGTPCAEPCAHHGCSIARSLRAAIAKAEGSR